jgi:hypothetical protein
VPSPFVLGPLLSPSLLCKRCVREITLLEVLVLDDEADVIFITLFVNSNNVDLLNYCTAGTITLLGDNLIALPTQTYFIINPKKPPSHSHPLKSIKHKSCRTILTKRGIGAGARNNSAIHQLTKRKSR